MAFSTLRVSIIIPVFNEELNIIPLIEKLNESLSGLSLKDYEAIFVDDGSTDKTFDNIIKGAKKYNFVKAIKLRRNFGKSAAYSVGFKNAKFDIIITMDGDMQDNPEEVKLFLEKINEKYDLVMGWKSKGKGTLGKTIVSRIFNQVVSWTFGIKLHDFDCSFKALRREVIDDLKIYSGFYRYIPVLSHTYGFKITEIEISDHPRYSGKSKYGGKRLLTGFYDYLTALFLIKFNQKPMHFFGSLALLCWLFGTIILSYMTFLSIKGIGVGSRPIFTLGVLLEIMSLQFFSIGFIGEMFTRSLVKTDSGHLIEKRNASY